MFPLLLPTWQERPFIPEDFEWGPAPVYVESSALRFQSQGMKHVKPTTKARMLTQLGKSGNAEAVPLITEKLKQFSAPQLQVTALKALNNFASSEKIDADTIKPFLDSKNLSVRREAVSLLGKINEVEPDFLLDVAVKATHNTVKSAALHAILRKNHSPGRIAYSQLDKLRQSENRKVRFLAWRLSCHTADVAAHKSSLISACNNDELTSSQAIAEQIPDLPENLATRSLEVLLNNTNSYVRTTLAEKIPDTKLADKLSPLEQLSKDSDPEVRRQAVKKLKYFPNRESVRVLLDALGDISAFVRKTAERGLISIHNELPVHKLCAGVLTADNPKKRYHALLVLASIGSHEQAPRIIKALRSADIPANIAAALSAAYHVRARNALSLIRNYTSHESERVRSSAAKALGMFSYKESNQYLKSLINDNSSKVHRNAIISMGRIGHRKFADSIIQVLKSVENTDGHFDVSTRLAACWAAAHITPADNSLAKRLRVQATERVIVFPMGPPAYENQKVMIACNFALADMAKESSEIKPIFQDVIQKHSKDRGSMSQFPNTPKLKEYARQAKAFYDDKQIESKKRPTRSLSMIYEKVTD